MISCVSVFNGFGNRFNFFCVIVFELMAQCYKIVFSLIS